MSTFIVTTDYDASIHSEILNAIVRNDPAIIEVAEDRAIEEMKSYLTSRYDVDNIFSRQGAARHNLVLMFAIDMALYHLHSIHNPAKLPDVRVQRYERAIEWLKQVSKGMINPEGLPILTPQDEKGQFLFGSNQKRGNHY